MRNLLLSLSACILVVGIGHAAPRPNIVHILTDDFGWQDPVCFDVDGETPLRNAELGPAGKERSQVHAGLFAITDLRAVAGGLYLRPVSGAHGNLSCDGRQAAASVFTQLHLHQSILPLPASVDRE